MEDSFFHRVIKDHIYRRNIFMSNIEAIISCLHERAISQGIAQSSIADLKEEGSF